MAWKLITSTKIGVSRAASQRRALTFLVVAAVAVGVGAPPASAAGKRCASVRISRSVTASVAIVSGRVSCSRARSLARELLGGNAPRHNGKDHAHSWSILSHGWRGSMNTGGWGARNVATGARISGVLL
jgi:hypothetical protein